MKKLLGLLLFSITLSSAFGQVKSKAYDKLLGTLLSHSVNELSVQESIKKTDSVVFLDAREPREYMVSHIKNAKLVGYDHFDINTLSNLPKSSQIIVYCSAGYRSEKIAEKLMANGYSNVHNLYGGIIEWKNQDQQVYDSTGVTERVHTYNKGWGSWLNKGKKVY